MTSRTAIPPGGTRCPRPGTSPFSIVDELNCYFDSAAEPNNVHLEAWLPGHLSPQRLRRAVSAVLADVPTARARRAGGPWWRTRYAWELPPEADLDPVSVTSWQDDAELDLARVRFLAAAPELHRSPPFRLLLAQGAGWDCVILNAHHAAFDGRSCVRLLSLIANRYTGEQRRAGPGPGGADAARTRSTDQAAAVRAASGAQATGLSLPVRRTARIARQHERAHMARRAPGYGLSLLEWPGIPVAEKSRGGPPVTVNDLLIAALMETIIRWNTTRRRRPARIRISMPADTRPPGRDDELGNLSRLCTVSAAPVLPVDPAAVAAQTRRAKSTPSPLASPVQMAVAGTPLPVPCKRGLARLGLRTLGSIGCDSSLLSNLGNVTDPPVFGVLTPVRMWFSTSAHMPRGLSVGAITVGGRLRLCFRYRNALLDAAAGKEFAAGYAAALSRLSVVAGPAGDGTGR